jgi:Ribbon-helix-helix protein, copG family
MPDTTTERSVGRPTTKDSTTVSLTMPQDLLDRVRRYARAQGQSVSALMREGLEWCLTAGDPCWRPTPGQCAAGNTARDEPAQPVPLRQEGMPCEADLAGAPQVPAPQAWGETWSRHAVVALILRWRQEGMTKTAIATRLNAAHVPPLSGKRGWNINKVTSALRAAPQGKQARQTFLALYAPPNAAALGREGSHQGVPRRSP